ncbi:MAG: hypothetical protein F4051_13315 [Boseongicola sp. SB0670_bin_30]|nr:hypothetical protein [Boseongicola sp. SB0670_bin_30]
MSTSSETGLIEDCRADARGACGGTRLQIPGARLLRERKPQVDAVGMQARVTTNDPQVSETCVQTHFTMHPLAESASIQLNHFSRPSLKWIKIHGMESNLANAFTTK